VLLLFLKENQMSFIQISDTHFIQGGGDLYETNPALRMKDGVAMINQDYKSLDFVLATGDLAHYGEKDAYIRLKAELDELEIPYYLMMGNHDSRAPFRDVFPDMPTMAGGFYQFALESGNMRILCLDSLNDVQGDHIGRLCDVRLRWLDEEIGKTPTDKKLVIANHHPPFDLGLPAMDVIKLRDSEALWEVLSRRTPDLMLFGHVHRPISGAWKGIPFHIQRGFNHQVALSFNDNLNIPFCEEYPDIAIVRNVEESLIVYTRSVGGELRHFPSGAENKQPEFSIL